MPSILDLPQFTEYRLPWQTRCARYARNRAYYSGKAYEKLSQYIWAQQLYSGTRTLFSPLRRCVRVDVAKVPSGWLLPDSASVYTRREVDLLRARTGALGAYERFLLYGAVAGEAALMLAGRPWAVEPDFVAGVFEDWAGIRCCVFVPAARSRVPGIVQPREPVCQDQDMPGSGVGDWAESKPGAIPVQCRWCGRTASARRGCC